MQEKQIVIGGTIEAVLYAYKNDLEIIYTKLKPPERFELFDNGAPKIDTFRKTLFLLSLCGLVPLENKVRFLRVEDENNLRVITENSRTVNVQYSKLIVFDEDGIEGLAAPVKKAREEYDVIDWISVRRGMVHKHDLLTDATNFVNCVHFYPSTRIDGNHNKKDVVAISRITAEQLQEFEYSATSARLKVEKMMRSAGIKGPKNGVCAVSGAPKHYALKLEQSHRQIKKAHRDKHKDTETIRFYHSKVEKISDFKTANNYSIKLKDFLET
jgi:hypothetical protein